MFLWLSSDEDVGGNGDGSGALKGGEKGLTISRRAAERNCVDSCRKIERDWTAHSIRHLINQSVSRTMEQINLRQSRGMLSVVGEEENGWLDLGWDLVGIL